MKKLMSLFFAGCFVVISYSVMAQGDDYIVHTIKRGEVISVLAKKYNVTVAEIIRLNKFGPNPILHVGDKVKLPVNALETVDTTQAAVKPIAPAEFKQEPKTIDTTVVHEPAPIIHVIERGEVLSVLAKKYNVTVAEIVKLNKFGPRPVLHVGDKIKLPASAHVTETTTVIVPQDTQPASQPVTPTEQPTAVNKEPEVQAPANGTIHVVRGKETLFAISKQYKVTVAQIKNWNHLTSDNISAGQKLVINNGKTGAITEQTAINTDNTAGQKVATPQPQQKAVAPVEVTSSPAVTLQPEKKKDAEPVVQKQAPAMPDPNVPASGYFSPLFGRDVNGRSLQTANGIAMTFKTASGWTDKKYYILMNDIAPGSIVQITSEEGKSIYAKVLWNMGDIKDNEGLNFRISDAAASALNLKANKFQLAVTYYE